jgi:hypothetical protein|tara:strand:+ start:2686 stop:4005 length:1320 start_codon:yes stop_codon:yes gene_type:complete
MLFNDKINEKIIENRQILLLNKFKEKIKRLKKKDIDVSLSALCYGCTWYDNFSLYSLKDLYLNNWKSKFVLFYFFLKGLPEIATIDNFNIKSMKPKQKFNNLILTWGKQSDFYKYTGFKDRYLGNKSSKNKKKLTIIFATEKIKHIKLFTNEILFFNNHKKNKYFLLLKTLLKLLLNSNFSFYKFYNYANFYSMFSILVLNKITAIIIKNDIKKINIPYEGQPFQDYLIKNLKINFPKIKITGYVHATQPLPLHLINKDNSIDKMVVSSHDQFYHMHKRLDWPTHKLSIKKNIKIDRIDKFKYINKIFLPYGVNDPILLARNFEILVKKNLFNTDKLIVKNHPAMTDSHKHKILSAKINKIILENKNKLSVSKSSFCILIGATSSVPEAFQSVKEIYHIYQDGIIETYAKYFWPNINILSINDHIVKYKTINKKKLFLI